MRVVGVDGAETEVKGEKRTRHEAFTGVQGLSVIYRII